MDYVEFPFNKYFDVHGVDTNNNYYTEFYFYADSMSNDDTWFYLGPSSSTGYAYLEW